MMTDPDPENRLICPNCSSLNSPHSVVCSSCGVKIDDYRAAMPRLQQLKDIRAASQKERLEGEKASQIQEAARKSRKSFLKLILFLLTGILILGLIISIGAILYANRVKQTQAELRAQFDASMDCLQSEKYLCARNGFQDLVADGADFPNLSNHLNEAQYGLARQYYESGQWEQAILEYDALLRNDPGNQMVLAEIEISYDRWSDQLAAERKWVKRWMVLRQRDARFPPTDD